MKATNKMKLLAISMLIGASAQSALASPIKKASGPFKERNEQAVETMCHSPAQSTSSALQLNLFSIGEPDDICSKPSCPLRLCGRCG